jgi:hypothetical protein
MDAGECFCPDSADDEALGSDRGSKVLIPLTDQHLTPDYFRIARYAPKWSWSAV